MRNWITSKEDPKAFWLSGFFFPQGFMTGLLQTHSRKYKQPINTLSFNFKVMDSVKFQTHNFDPPVDGVYVYGLFLNGAAWETQNQTLIDLPIG